MLKFQIGIQACFTTVSRSGRFSNLNYRCTECHTGTNFIKTVMIIIPYVALFNIFAVTMHCECVSLQIKSLPLSFNDIQETELLLNPFSSQLTICSAHTE